jgi:hypothetical protein
MIRQVLPRILCLHDEYKCTCWHHVTNPLIISNDKDSNTEKQKKIYASVTPNPIRAANVAFMKLSVAPESTNAHLLAMK